MSIIIKHILYDIIDILFAPLYFHFGALSFIVELNVIMFEIADIIATYFLFFFFIIGIALMRNFILWVYNRIYLKKNDNSFFIFTNLIFFKKIYSYFKKFFK